MPCRGWGGQSLPTFPPNPTYTSHHITCLTHLSALLWAQHKGFFVNVLVKQEFLDEFARRTKQERLRRLTVAEISHMAETMNRYDSRNIEKRCERIVHRVMNPPPPELSWREKIVRARAMIEQT